MTNMPDVKLGIVAVSRDCFPKSLSENRRKAVAAACKLELFEAPTVVEALAALEAGEELCLPLLAGEEDGPWLLDWEEWRGAV